MSDTLITIIAIFLAAILMFVFPLMTMADRTDDVSQLVADSAVTTFVKSVTSTGKITLSDYETLISNLSKTQNTYDVNIELQSKDENYGKKDSLGSDSKVGEASYYSSFLSQIEEKLYSDGEYLCKEGDIITVTARNTNLTLAQQIKNALYTVVGNDSYTIAAQSAGVCTVNGK